MPTARYAFVQSPRRLGQSDALCTRLMSLLGADKEDRRSGTLSVGFSFAARYPDMIAALRKSGILVLVGTAQPAWVMLDECHMSDPSAGRT